ncbi:MAG TPA: PAS domain S-box protein [Armatimonadota bacterium]
MRPLLGQGTNDHLELRIYVGDIAFVLLSAACIYWLMIRRSADGQALEQSEERWHLMFEAADEIVVLVDDAGLITACNSRAIETYQYARDALIGKPLSMLQTPYHSLMRSLANKDTHDCVDAFYETEHQRSDGKPFTVEVSVKTITSGQRKQKMYIIRDVTARKRAEATLTYERHLFDILMNNVTDPIYFKDVEGRFIRVNTGIVKRFGMHEAAEVIGKTDFDFFATEHAQQAYQDEQQVMATGQPIVGQVEMETWRDGSRTWVSTSKMPLYDKDGRLSGTFGISRDVTDLKIAEEAVRGHERFLSSIFGSIQDGICVLDTDLNIVQVNAAMEAWFADSCPLVGKKCYTAYHTRGTACENCPSLRTIASGEVETELIQTRLPGSSGATWLELHSFPLVDAETEQVTGVIEYVRDVTARKHAEEELEHIAAELARSNEELEQFAYVASHDLQEPLRMVASYVQLLQRRYRGKLDSDADEFIAFAVDGASRMKELINDLLTYSRVGTQGKPFTETDANLIVQRALANLQLAIEDRQAEVLCAALPTLTVDASQLTQLFQNLIGNAIKFQQDTRPRVEITATPEPPGYWTFAVRDNGIGIDPQYADRIFAIFQRLHSKEEYAGTGIGLAVCKKIVERHGGSIRVESAPGQGATFLFTIPSE